MNALIEILMHTYKRGPQIVRSHNTTIPTVCEVCAVYTKLIVLAAFPFGKTRRIGVNLNLMRNRLLQKKVILL